MKKLLISLCTLAAVITSCTKSQVIDLKNDDVLINFNPYSGRTITSKASVSNIDSLGKYGFQVYAFMHSETNNANYTTPYMDKTVTKDATSGAWTYPGAAYWPNSYYLDFIAYGINNNITTKITEDPKNYTELEFEVKDSVKLQTDLIVAKARLNQQYNEAKDGTLDLNFSHLLSKVGFSLITKQNNTLLVCIEEVKLKGKFYSKGKINLLDSAQVNLHLNSEDITKHTAFISTEGYTAEPKEYSLLPYDDRFVSASNAEGVSIYNNGAIYQYSDVSGDEGYALIDGKSETNVEENTKDRYMMIIPTDFTEAAVLEVTYKLPGVATDFNVTVPLVKETTDGTAPIKFEAGKSYDFKFKISTNGIGFNVTVDEWDTATGDLQSTNHIFQLN